MQKFFVALSLAVFGLLFSCRSCAMQPTTEVIELIQRNKQDFVRACNEGEVDKLIEVMERVAPYYSSLVNEPLVIEFSNNKGASDYCLWTALHLASVRRNVVLMKKLIEYDARVNTIDSTGHTPLHYAIGADCLDAVQLLLENNALVNIETGRGETSLQLAQRRNSPAIVGLLIAYGVK